MDSNYENLISEKNELERFNKRMLELNAIIASDNLLASEFEKYIGKKLLVSKNKWDFLNIEDFE